MAMSVQAMNWGEVADIQTISATLSQLPNFQEAPFIFNIRLSPFPSSVILGDSGGISL